MQVNSRSDDMFLVKWIFMGCNEGTTEQAHTTSHLDLCGGLITDGNS